MSTLEGRDGSALLVIDVQNGVIDGAYRRDDVVGTIRSLVDRARKEGVPVVWVQHSDDNVEYGSDAWQYVPELSRSDAEALVPKHYADAFEETTLEQVLAAAGVGRIVVTGSQTDECIRSTIHGGLTRGYDVTLFPNLDLTIHLHTQPTGRWVGLDTTVTFGPTGQGLTSTELHDERGPVGRAEQTLTVRPAPGA